MTGHVQSQSQVVDPWVIHTSVWITCKLRVLMKLFSGLKICCNGSQKSGKHFIYYYQLLQRINKHPGELVHKQSPEQELLSSRNWDSLPCQHVDVFNNLEAIWTPYSRIFMETLSSRHYQLLTQSSAPPLSLEDWGWGGADGSKFLFAAQSFWWPAPSWNYPGAHKELPQGNKIQAYCPGNSKGFRSFLKETPYHHITEKTTRVLGGLCQELGTVSKYIFPIMSQPLHFVQVW